MAIFYIRRDDQGNWRWSFVADNGRTMAVSSEGYATKSGCVAAIRLIQNRGPQAPVSERGVPEEASAPPPGALPRAMSRRPFGPQETELDLPFRPKGPR